MKIHSVAQGKDYFFIYTDDGTGIVQRKHTLFATDPWLTSDEKTIIALCQNYFHLIQQEKIMGNFCGMTATDVLKTLFDIGIIRSVSIKPRRKPTHGPCCTCQACGYYHDECVCDDNEIIKAIKKLEKDKILK